MGLLLIPFLGAFIFVIVLSIKYLVKNISLFSTKLVVLGLSISIILVFCISFLLFFGNQMYTFAPYFLLPIFTVILPFFISKRIVDEKLKYSVVLSIIFSITEISLILWHLEGLIQLFNIQTYY